MGGYDWYQVPSGMGMSRRGGECPEEVGMSREGVGMSRERGMSSEGVGMFEGGYILGRGVCPGRCVLDMGPGIPMP